MSQRRSAAAPPQQLAGAGDDRRAPRPNLDSHCTLARLNPGSAYVLRGDPAALKIARASDLPSILHLDTPVFSAEQCEEVYAIRRRTLAHHFFW